MDENDVLTPELEAAIDAEWDESGADSADSFDDEDTEPQTSEPDRAEEETQTPEAEQTEQTPAPEQQAAPESDQTLEELYTLKNRDETKQVNLDEMKMMAQKGWDYDKVREERDQLRSYRDEADPALNYIKSLAQRSNMTVPDYLDYCRQQELMSTGLNEATAKAQVDLEKRQAALDAQEAQRKAEQEEAQRKQEEADRQKESQKAELLRFMKTFPDVKAESIPQEVWTDVRKGIPMTTAYTMYQNRQLQSELAAMRQNNDAKARAPGSMNSAGENTPDPDFDGWDDD